MFKRVGVLAIGNFSEPSQRGNRAADDSSRVLRQMCSTRFQIQSHQIDPSVSCRKVPNLRTKSDRYRIQSKVPATMHELQLKRGQNHSRVRGVFGPCGRPCLGSILRHRQELLVRFVKTRHEARSGPFRYRSLCRVSLNVKIVSDI